MKLFHERQCQRAPGPNSVDKHAQRVELGVDDGQSVFRNPILAGSGLPRYSFGYECLCYAPAYVVEPFDDARFDRMATQRSEPGRLELFA